jgi:dipeptidase
MEYKMRNKIFMIVIFSVVFLLASFSRAEECTTLIAGKKTTVDGSILYAKTEDDGPKEVDFLWYVPGKTHESGAVVKLKAGGTIPQVKKTYAYFWDQCPGTPYSNNIINEWGVAFGSNACRSKEDPVEKVETRGDLVNGGLGFRLRMILAERAKTAREAVLIAAKLLNQYGYNASGRNLNIVGPHEAWQLQMVRGKNYVARRVQDDEVAIIANTFSIREVDMKDKKNFICSPTLISYAIKQGWYDPEKDGKFDFAKAYAPEQAHKSPGNTHRQWIMAKLLNKNFPITPEESTNGVMPVAVKPDRKLSLRDIMAIFRSHYEGTSLDKSGFTRDKEYKITPHKTRYNICNYGTHRTTIIQQRSWLPPAIGTVTWRALDEPCSSGFVPWYLGATRIPEEFCKAPESLYTTKKDLLDFHFNAPVETWDLDMETASGVFTHLGRMVDANYGSVIDYVKSQWQKFESQAFALQPIVEKSALELYNKDKNLAHEYLNLYTASQAIKSLKTAKNMLKTIKDQLWRGHNKIRVASGGQGAFLKNRPLDPQKTFY